MVNILAWCDVRRKFRITTDTNAEAAINVHISKNHTIKFKEVESGLYIYNMEDTTKDNNGPLGHSFLNLTSENMSNFTKSQIRQAERAKKSYTAIRMPSYDKYISLLNQNLIRNCPVTTEDVKRALFIWGPEIATIKGKTTRIKPKHAPNTTTIPLPRTTQDFHSAVTLCIDFFYVNGIPLLHTISRSYKFRTIEEVDNRAQNTMINGIKRVVNLYKCRGITIDNIHADNKFACCKGALGSIKLNIAGAGMHVGEVERSIQTIKERVRCITHNLPFKRYPKVMSNACVTYNIKLLNQIPPND